MSLFAVIRASTKKNIDDTIRNLLNDEGISLIGEPKKLNPEYADDILVSVLNSELKNECSVAAIISINGNPGEIIKKLKSIPTPAHVIIITTRHDIYDEINEEFAHFSAL